MNSGKERYLGGIRRPVFKLALFWILFLCLLHGLGIPLEKPAEAERYLKEQDGAALGILRGTLSEIALNSSGHYSLTLRDSSFTPEDGGGPLPARAVLVYFPATADLVPGPVLEIRGSLRLFREADNPGEFDARAFYRARGMVCYMEGDALRVAKEGRDIPAEAAWRSKCFLRAGLEKLYDSEEAGLLGAMLLGERGGVSEETEALYEGAGLSHLLSVSGLHVSFWAAVLGRLAGGFLSLFPFHRGRSFWSRRGFGLIRTLVVLGGILFYCLICGSRIPTQRAGLMALLYHMTQGLGLSFDLPSALGAAALAALIPAPHALFQPSFQLSFGCVFLLGCLLPLLLRRMHMEGRLSRAMLVPVLLQMGMLPLTLWHYFTFRPWSFLANLLVVPLAGILLAGGFLSAILAHLSMPLGGAMAGTVQLLLSAIRLLCLGLRELPFHTLVPGRPELWQILAYLGLALLGAAWIFCLRRREAEDLILRVRRAGEPSSRRAFREARGTALLLFLWLLGAGCLFFIREENGLRLTSLYVGQGDSQIIAVPGGHYYLLDGGGSSDKVGENVILPYLKCSGISRLEYMIVSHPDSDHICGLEAVLKDPGIRVQGLLMPVVFQDSEKAAPLLVAAREAGVSLFYVKAGDTWEDGPVRFTVLYPGRETQVDDNESSLVLRLETEAFSALYTGDVGEMGEAMLLKAYGEALETAQVLKAGHHGSRFGTTEAFLERIKPEITLISSGRNNRYGHPAEETLERLEGAGSRVLRTDRAGAIELTIGEEGSLSVQTFHEREDDLMQKEEKKKEGRFTILASILILAAGAAAMAYSLLSGGKGGLEESLAALIDTGAVYASESSRESGTTHGVAGSSNSWWDNPASASTTWPVTTPVSRESGIEKEPTLSPRPLAANAGRGGAAQDPQAEGFYLDMSLTDELYALLAGDLTNNMDPADPFRCLSATFKEDLDRIAEAFAAGEITEAEGKAAFKGMNFSWPEDKLGLIHPIGDTFLRCYSFPGRDMELAKERILLSNVTPRHYLFLRVYYNPAQDAVRIYMVNGLIY